VQNTNEKKVVELKLSEVLPNRFQPRIKFDEESINELAESIKKYGVIQPIVVRQIGEKYEIIAGERRYKASIIAGKETIPAIVYDLSDKESVEIALLENVQREDLTPIEKAISYKKILDMGYINQEELAKKIGKSQSSIANTLRLLNLAEEVQEALLNTKISERHARSLLKIKDENKQVEMLNRIINERLTVRKTDEEIEKMGTENNLEIPDIKMPEDNYELPGFMNIDKIEQEAQDIAKEEKPEVDFDSLLKPSPINATGPTEPEDVLQSGKFFNLFADEKENQEMDQLLSSTNDVTMPEFNFEVPTVETPVESAPVMPEFNFDVPTVEPAVEAMPAMPEFNFDVPTVEPAVEAMSAMPEFNFEVPTVETAVETAPVMPEFNFEVPTVEPTVEAMPAMPEFNFDVPTVETPVESAPVMPEFNFDVPIVETPVESAPVMPEFNFGVPTVEPAVEAMPAMPEFNFDVPTVEPTVEAMPAMPEFNFEVPTVEPTVEAMPAMPEFNFDVPTVEPAVETAPVMPEFNFELPTVEPAVESAPVMPEFNFEVPTVETPVEAMPAMPEFNFDVPTVEPAVESAPVMPEFNFEVPTVEPAVEAMPAMPEFNFDVPTVEPAVEDNNETDDETGNSGLNLFELPIDMNDSIASINNASVEAMPAMPEFNFEVPTVEQPVEVASTIEQPTENKNVRLAIDTIRNCEDNLQKMGFIVDVDELDFDNSYQVTIKINK